MSDSNKTYNFPAYLRPSLHLPFRRRSQASPPTTPPSLSSSPTLSTPNSSPSTSPPTFSSLDAIAISSSYSRNRKDRPRTTRSPRLTTRSPDILVCLHCSTHLAYASQITSKGFTGRHGRAYLVSPPPPPPSSHLFSFSPSTKAATSPDLVNIRVGRNASRQLVTGQHVVADISCATCGTIVGWKYVDAKEPAQKYKIGRFILEVMRVTRVAGWGDEEDDDEGGELEARVVKDEEGEGEIVFDSDDDDECEELFAGTWDEDVVRKRRGRRGWMRSVRVS